MLETYFVQPQTVDRVRASWIGSQIERDVVWLAEHGYGTRAVLRRVPLLAAFGESARLRGARSVEDLPAHVEAFVAQRVGDHRGPRRGGPSEVAREVRGPVEQMLGLVVQEFEGTRRKRPGDPFVAWAPGFFTYLVSERGLRPAAILHYQNTTCVASRRICVGSGSHTWRVVSGGRQRLRRRAQRRPVGQDHHPGCLRGAADLPALRAPRRPSFKRISLRRSSGRKPTGSPPRGRASVFQ